MPPPTETALTPHPLLTPQLNRVRQCIWSVVSASPHGVVTQAQLAQCLPEDARTQAISLSGTLVNFTTAMLHSEVATLDHNDMALLWRRDLPAEQLARAVIDICSRRWPAASASGNAGTASLVHFALLAVFYFYYPS